MADVADRYCLPCGKKIMETNNVVVCKGFCKEIFHTECVKLPNSKEKNKKWLCGRDDCQVRSVNNNLKNVLQKVEQDLAKMEQMLKIVQKETNDLTESTDFFNGEFQKLQTDIVTIKNELKKMPNLSEVSEVMEDTKQYLRRNNVEIHGVPEIDGEDVYKVVENIASALNVDVVKNDIDVAHRLPSNKPGLPKPIVVKFIRRWKKEELMKAKKQKKDLSTQDLGLAQGKAQVIYLNDHLTPYYKLLHKKLRDLRPQIKYVWVRDSKLFAKKEDGASTVCIKSEKDISSLMAQSSGQ